MSTAGIPTPVIIDLGKKKASQVKDLRRGEGELMDDVRDAIDELAGSGTIANGVAPVIIVVEKKAKAAAWDKWM